MWSKVFLVEKDGVEVAVALVDTQGTFDNETSTKDEVAIFALSLLTSSVLVFNLSQKIQADHLQHLQFFTEFGKLAKIQTGGKAFQQLHFLIRDWPVRLPITISN